MRKILIANRGEIAVRIIDTCRKINIPCVAVFSDADRNAPHVERADEAVYIGAAPAAESYLNPARILQGAAQTGADAIHPGYGFLSENADFARAVLRQNLTWIGPPPEAMETMASKSRARELALAHEVPVVPGLSLAPGESADAQALAALGLPLLIKAAAGGGGIGMREVNNLLELETVLEEAREQAQRQFGDASLLLERLVTGARHVEVQVAGDRHGTLLHLHDRDCSLQRRRQKLVEEAPAAALPEPLREALHKAALRLATAVGYYSVGTVEFLVQGEEFFLLEMNTRLQVEHGVTEAVLGLDLVQLQIEIADGASLTLRQDQLVPQGHAIEARIYAEQPGNGFAPSTGTISAIHLPRLEGLRVDSGVAAGFEVGQHYDGLLCKLIAHGADRAAATRTLRRGLSDLCIAGLPTNQRLLGALLQDSRWQDNKVHTRLVEDDLPRFLHQCDLPATALLGAARVATVWDFLRSPPPADRAPWPGGFHYRRTAHWQLQGSSDGEAHDIHWQWGSRDRFFFGDNDSVIQVLQQNGNTLLLDVDGVRAQFHCYPGDDGVTVYNTTLGSITLRRADGGREREHPRDPRLCTSAGPGLVLKLLVEPDQVVSAGDALVVIESMKMETTLNAGCAGRVTDIRTSAGALVETGQVLLRVDSAADAGG